MTGKLSEFILFEKYLVLLTSYRARSSWSRTKGCVLSLFVSTPCFTTRLTLMFGSVSAMTIRGRLSPSLAYINKCVGRSTE